MDRLITDPAAIVSGGAARVIGQALRALARRGDFDPLPPHVRAEVLDAVGAIESAGERWLSDAAKAGERHREQRSVQAGRIGVTEAARLLGYSEVWVRECARGGEWDAVKRRSRWTVDRGLVLDEIERRRTG